MIADDPCLKKVFAEPLSKALRIRWHNRHQLGPSSTPGTRRGRMHRQGQGPQAL